MRKPREQREKKEEGAAGDPPAALEISFRGPFLDEHIDGNVLFIPVLPFSSLLTFFIYFYSPFYVYDYYLLILLKPPPSSPFCCVVKHSEQDTPIFSWVLRSSLSSVSAKSYRDQVPCKQNFLLFFFSVENVSLVAPSK